MGPRLVLDVAGNYMGRSCSTDLDPAIAAEIASPPGYFAAFPRALGHLDLVSEGFIV